MSSSDHSEAMPAKRDDRAALALVLDKVQDLVRSNADGSKPLPAIDQEFLAAARAKLGQYGLIGGLFSGGLSMVLLRNARGSVRFPGVVGSWIIGSGVGRFAGVDAALEDMFRLGNDSVLGPVSRRLVLQHAETNGYIAKRYNLNIAAAEAGDLPGLVGNSGGAASPFLSEPVGAGFEGGDGIDSASEGFLKDYFDKPASTSAGPGEEDSSASVSATGGRHSGAQQPSLAQGRPSWADDSFPAFDPFAAPDESSRAQGKGGARSVYDDYDDRFRAGPPTGNKSWEDLRRERDQAAPR